MLQNALKTLLTLLPKQSVTRTEIEQEVDSVFLLPKYQSIDRNLLIREAELFYNIRVEDYRIIEGRDRTLPWLSNKMSEINWGFWKRYREYLEGDKNLSFQVINQLDRLTNKILDSTFDPTAKILISKRGLVVGQVQSGKTSNYTGLICKAADAGFKLIIVLAGVHNNLRSQTQLRLDEGFLGFDTEHQRVFDSKNKWLGVGISQVNRKGCVSHSMTSSLDKGDFSGKSFQTSGINFGTTDTIIAVVKKNTTILRNLYNWLDTQAQEFDNKRFIREKSLLLIDDEADNASINTSKDNVTAINNHIRNILNLFERNAYVGYTATPFANVFIPVNEQGDIFPRDFIVNLPAPSNYIGPEKVFGFTPLEEVGTSDFVLPILNKIDDGDKLVPEGHTRRTHPTDTELPESLKLAIKSFILTCTIRQLRGQEKAHNSMLIHVSRYTNWQRHIFDLVQNTFDYYKRGISYNDEDMLGEFKQIFEGNITGYKNFVQVSSEILASPFRDLDSQIQVHEWQDVIKHLSASVQKIEVREINGGSKDALNYFDHKDGLSVIAIGGDKLSRGLTLEGLSVSYFLRASKMYDTLMQMGRWFGYRQGYADLCRLFTTRELNEWFCHITKASEELRREFDYMSDVAGSTPEKYALKVRTHPGLLQISASNKLRSAVELSFSFSGRLVETYEFVKDESIFKNNFKITQQFIKQLGQNDATKSAHEFIWRNVSPIKILQFLSNYQLAKDQPLRRAEPQFIRDYINLLLPVKELDNWSVALISNSQTKEVCTYKIAGSDTQVGLTVRNADKSCSTETSDKRKNQKIYYLKKSHIISPNHEYIDIDKELVEKRIEKEKKEITYLSGEIIRNEVRSPRNPLLIIYSLATKDVEGLEDMQDLGCPIIGFAISFPKSMQDDRNINIAYAIQEQLLPYFQNDDEFDNSTYED